MTNHNVERSEKLNARRRRNTDMNVGLVSVTNRADLASHVEEYRHRCRETSVMQFAISVRRADEVLNMDFRQITTEAARKLVGAFRRMYSEGAVRPRVILARQHIRWLFGVKRLDEQGSACVEGKAIERALCVPKHRPKVVGIVLTKEQQDRLVSCLPKRSSLRPAFPMEVRDAWILRGLKGTGDRISKFVSLRLRDVQTEVHTVDGKPVLVARLSVDPKASDLKTDASAVYIREGVSELVAWLKCHPGVQSKDSQDWGSFDGNRDAAVPDAALNLRSNSRDLCGIEPDTIAKLIDLACKTSGLNRELPARLTPHDFRHTAATEDARLGWNEPALRLKYDWGTDSRMPAHYTHLTLDDQRNRILADANRAAKAAITSSPTSSDAVSALLALVQQAATQMGRSPVPA